MTEKECLQAIVKGWSELAINPELLKRETSLINYSSMCPCCAYVRQKGYGDSGSSADCSDLLCHTYCPMISAWPQGCINNADIKDSLFTEWVAASGYDKCFFAALIAEWGEYLLNKLEEKKL